MEGSGAKRVDRSDPKVIFGRAGLSPKAGAAWMKRRYFTGNFKRDAATASKLWREGSAFLAKLPRKLQRTQEQTIAANIIQYLSRDARERFLARHADAVYRKLTRNHQDFLRVDKLAYEAAKLVPGLTPTRKQVQAESTLMQSEKDGVEVDQGIFLANVLAGAENGMHLCHAMLRPKLEAIERMPEFIEKDVVDFGPARVERKGKDRFSARYSFQPLSFVIDSSRARRSSSRLASAHSPS